MATKHPLTAKGARYSRDIVSGKIDACMQVKQACQRQIDDLKKQSNANYPYRFDKDKAEKVCKFIQLMPHQKGKWRGTNITLEPWQCFIVSTVFGWVKKSNGKRRYTEAVIEVPRKNGKSLLAAGINLYMGFADGEPAAEVYCAATSEKQAFEVHRPMWLMTKMSPHFRNKFGIDLSGTEVNPGTIYSMETGSRCSVVIGNPPDGQNVAAYCQDEYHESKDSRSYDTGMTGMGSREQPLMLVMSTAGTNTSYPFYELIKRIRRILSGDIVNDGVFGIEYTIDEKVDDWTDFNVWKKANPNYGVSIFDDFLRKQLQTAIQSTVKQNIIKCKHLDVWSNAGSAWMNMVEWEKCHDPSMTLADFHGKPCYIGLDLASKIDIAAKMYLFKIGEDYHLFSKYWIPEERTFGEDMAHYAGWVHDDAMEATSGSRIDIEMIQDTIKQDAKDFDLSGSENGGGEICNDPWNAQQLITNLLNEGVECVEISQTVQMLSEPMKEIEAIVKSGKLHHDGNPVTYWMIANICCRVDKKDNIFPFKEGDENKIDGGVAFITAMSRAIYNVSTVSIYESRGVLTFN